MEFGTRAWRLRLRERDKEQSVTLEPRHYSQEEARRAAVKLLSMPPDTEVAPGLLLENLAAIEFQWLAYLPDLDGEGRWVEVVQSNHLNGYPIHDEG